MEQTSKECPRYQKNSGCQSPAAFQRPLHISLRSKLTLREGPSINDRALFYSVEGSWFNPWQHLQGGLEKSSIGEHVNQRRQNRAFDLTCCKTILHISVDCLCCNELLASGNSAFNLNTVHVSSPHCWKEKQLNLWAAWGEG